MKQSEQIVLPRRMDAHSLLLPFLLIFLLSRVVHWKLTWDVAWVLSQTCPVYPGTSLIIMVCLALSEIMLGPSGDPARDVALAL